MMRASGAKAPDAAGSGARPPGRLTHRLGALVVAFLRFRLTDDIATLRTHLRGLVRDERRAVCAGLVFSALLVVITPALAGLAPRLDALPFPESSRPGGTATVSTPALAVALAGFAVAWSYLLAGAAAGPGLLWIAASLLYAYQVWPIGFPLGRSVLHLVPLGLPVAIAALTPHGSRWGKVVAAVLLASIGARSLPGPPGTARLLALLAVVGAAFLGLQAVLARRRASAGWRVALGTSVLLAHFLVVAVVSGDRAAMAGTLNGSLFHSLWFLTILWFLLGASFVSGAVALARFARDALEIAMPHSSPGWMLATGWGLLAAWVWGLPAGDHPLPLRPLSAVIAGAGLAAVVVVWVRRGMTRQRLSTVFVVTAAALVILRAALTLDLDQAIDRGAGALALLAFVFALVWEVIGRIPHIPLQTRHLSRPAPLLLYMGAIPLVSASMLFGFAAGLDTFQRLALLSQFKGAAALWVPILLLMLARSWPAFPPQAGRRVVAAFAAGMVMAIPGVLLRTALPSAMVDGGLVLAIAAAAAALVVRWPDAHASVPSIAVGYALAYGFAASLAQVVLIPVLAGLLEVVGTLFPLNPASTLADALLGAAMAATWSAVDQQLFYVVTPGLAGLAAMAAARIAARITRT
ncbi:MAG: hypothetical protein QN120_04865 [Armatimonadota bacterium]|nr:hypothetical protein [Armatimonadota bacterium]